MRTTLAAVTALLAGAVILLLGNGLLGLLLPVRAHIEGLSAAVIGGMFAAYYAGFVAGCALGPLAVRRAGHIRAFAAFAATAATVAMAHSLLVEPLAWTLLRALFGMCAAGLYTVVESWLNERSGNAERGTVLAVYGALQGVAVVAGQMLLALADPAGHVPFILVGMAVCLSLVPVSLTRAPAPAPLVTARLRLVRLYRLSPVAVVGCLAIGLANGAFWALAPVFAQERGLSVTGVALLMSAAVAGGAVGQWPLGRLSDHIDRRAVIVGVCLGAMAAAAGLVLTRDETAALASAALFGACVFPLYSLCIAHANDTVDAEHFVETSSGLLLLFGLGAIAGPLAASAAVSAAGIEALFLHTAAVHLGLAAFTLHRMRRRASPPPEERPDFVAVPRTTPAVFQLDPRAPDGEAAAAAPRGETAAAVG